MYQEMLAILRDHGAYLGWFMGARFGLSLALMPNSKYNSGPYPKILYGAHVTNSLFCCGSAEIGMWQVNAPYTQDYMKPLGRVFHNFLTNRHDSKTYSHATLTGHQTHTLLFLKDNGWQEVTEFQNFTYGAGHMVKVLTFARKNTPMMMENYMKETSDLIKKVG